jgi:mono/diheme cytochrome c family protein
MTAGRGPTRVWAWCAVALLGTLAWLLCVGHAPLSAQAPKPDPEDVAEGLRLYRTKADCQTCHGWAADGRKMDTQMPDAPSPSGRRGSAALA